MNATCTWQHRGRAGAKLSHINVRFGAVTIMCQDEPDPSVGPSMSMLSVMTALLTRAGFAWRDADRAAIIEPVVSATRDDDGLCDSSSFGVDGAPSMVFLDTMPHALTATRASVGVTQIDLDKPAKEKR